MDFSKLLVTGGIFAAVTAGWSQVKAAFAYISRFLIIRSTVLDESLGMSIVRLLKSDWHQVPDGLFTYTGVWQSLKDRSTLALLPFSVMNQSTIWYRKSGRGFQLVFMKSQPNGLSLSALRGFADFNQLIRDAAIKWDDRRMRALEVERPDRHFLALVMGSEKGIHAANLENMERSTTISSGSRESPPDSAGGSYVGSHPDLEYDTPLLYSRSDFQSTHSRNPFDALYYSPSVMRVVEDCQLWLDSADWFQSRSIPWRRGVLLHGPGGTGKSSLALATAQKLKIPLHQYFLATLSDQEFVREWRGMGTPCVVLFEEFDTVFDGRESLTNHKTLTFDCILNMLSGVSSSNGILLFITTNHIHKLDEALGVSSVKQDNGDDVVISTRPGRIDQVVYLGKASHDCRMHIASRCLSDWPEDIQGFVDTHTDLSPVQFQELCVTHALHRKRDDARQAVSINGD